MSINAELRERRNLHFSAFDQGAGEKKVKSKNVLFFFLNFMNANLPNPTQGQEYQDK